MEDRADTTLRRSEMSERGAAERLDTDGRSRALWLVVALTAIGAFLRVATVSSRGLWLDEASQVGQFSGTVWETILSQIGGTHPPLYHVMMHFWIGWFGTSEVALRMGPLLVGVASIPLAYWSGATLYNRSVGLAAATVLAFSPYHIWYSQEARMYSLLLFFGLLSLTTFVKALRSSSWARWLAYFVVTVLGLFVQYFFLLLLGGQWLYYFFVEFAGRLIRLGHEGERESSWRRPLRVFRDVPTLTPWLLTNLALVGCVLLWMNWAIFFPPFGSSSMVSSLSTTGLGYGAPPPSFALRFNDIGMTIVELLSGFHPPWIVFALVAMWPLVIYFFLLLLGRGRQMKPQTSFLLFSMLSGTFVVWGLGQWQGVVLLSRYLMGMASAAVVLAGLLLMTMSRNARRLAVAAAVVISLAAWVNQSYAPDSMGRYQNREAIQYLAQNHWPSDVVIYEPFYIDDLMNYYLPEEIPSFGFPMFGQTGVFRDTPAMMGQDLDRVIGPAKRVWVVRSFQNVKDIKANAAVVDAWFADNGYTLVEDTQFNKVQVLRFEGDGSRDGGLSAPEAN